MPRHLYPAPVLGTGIKARRIVTYYWYMFFNHMSPVKEFVELLK